MAFAPYRNPPEAVTTELSEDERRRIISDMITGRRDRDVVRERKRRELLRPAGLVTGAVLGLTVVLFVVGTVPPEALSSVVPWTVVVALVWSLRGRRR